MILSASSPSKVRSFCSGVLLAKVVLQLAWTFLRCNESLIEEAETIISFFTPDMLLNLLALPESSFPIPG